MSRIGKRPITLPAGVTATLSGKTLTVKGSKATLVESFDRLQYIDLQVKDNQLIVSRKGESRDSSREQGLARAMIQNMVSGVTQGFTRELDIVGVGYRAELKGKVLNLSLGYSHPVEFPIPEGISIEVEKQTRLKVLGADRSLVGETAAQIRRFRMPEPYKGKGIKYVDEVIRRKAGKSAASGGGK